MELFSFVLPCFHNYKVAEIIFLKKEKKTKIEYAKNLLQCKKLIPKSGSFNASPYCENHSYYTI